VEIPRIEDIHVEVVAPHEVDVAIQRASRSEDRAAVLRTWMEERWSHAAVLMLSRIGSSRDGRQALCYVQRWWPYRFDDHLMQGSYYLLEEGPDRWHVVGEWDGGEDGS